MTYDPTETTLAFTRQNNINFPILHDENARHVIAFGIRNEAYEPGHRAYGIPHPGIFVVDRTGKVVAKFAEADYRDRPAMALVLEAARAMAQSDNP